jgi:hypothetical protein
VASVENPTRSEYHGARGAANLGRPSASLARGTAIAIPIVGGGKAGSGECVEALRSCSGGTVLAMALSKTRGE